MKGLLAEKTKSHPCYAYDAHHQYARLHLPVAPKCNISCNYCSRKFDCVNESRPGVTSEVLTPEKALIRFRMVQDKLKNLSVVGIAGPGDALANWDQTKKTLELIRKENQDVTFCLSTNGLLLPELAEEIVSLDVYHVTVTVNSIHPGIGSSIYKDIHYQDQVIRGIEGVRILIQNQLEGIKKLVENGVLVKVNTVMIEGVNDHHIPEVVKKAKELGVFTSNIMGLIPVQGSVFQDFPATNPKNIAEMRKQCGEILQQMLHCKQCRADAIGMLGKDCSEHFIEGRKKCSRQKEAG